MHRVLRQRQRPTSMPVVMPLLLAVIVSCRNDAVESPTGPQSPEVAVSVPATVMQRNPAEAEPAPAGPRPVAGRSLALAALIGAPRPGTPGQGGPNPNGRPGPPQVPRRAALTGNFGAKFRNQILREPLGRQSSYSMCK